MCKHLILYLPISRILSLNDDITSIHQKQLCEVSLKGDFEQAQKPKRAYTSSLEAYASLLMDTLKKYGVPQVGVRPPYIGARLHLVGIHHLRQTLKIT